MLINMIKQHIRFTNYWFLTFLADEVDQADDYHEKIIQALRFQDAETAGEHMQEHIITVCNTLIDQVRNKVPSGTFRLN